MKESFAYPPVVSINNITNTKPERISRENNEARKESNERLDPRKGRSQKEKEEEGGNRLKMEKITLETGISTPPPATGNESGCKTASCLVAGFPDGCHPENPSNHPETNKGTVRFRKLSRPKNFLGNGKSYLRCTPMAAKFRLRPDAPEIMGLTNICSNTGLIDSDLFRLNYPEREILPGSTEVMGVGKDRTLGFAVVPIWFDCFDKSNELVRVEIDVELHVLRDFSAKLLIGLDAILDYQIDISVQDQWATVKDLKFKLFCNAQTPLEKVRVRAKEDVTIPGRTTKAIAIKSAMAGNMDYMFDPLIYTPRGFIPTPQLPYAAIDRETRYLMFSNHGYHPITIHRGLTLGEARAMPFGSQISKTSEVIDWSNLMRPCLKREDKTEVFGTSPPQTISDKDDFTFGQRDEPEDETKNYEDMLSFNAHGRENERPPRSISEEEVRRITGDSKKRERGDRFPCEDEGEQPPEAPMAPPAGSPDICKNLSEQKRRELSELLQEYKNCFSDGSIMGRIDPKFFKATIKTKGPIPPPQQNRPVGPAKRQVIGETIDDLLNWDIAEASESSTASAIVLVWQNDKWRFCVDFRGVNAVTEGDAYPMLRSDYVFSAMAGKRYFSMLDAVKGYHQLEIDEKDRWKTAFISHKGLYQYKRMPFGLRNAPAQFQRMMDKVLGSLRWQAALVYIDDVIVFSASWTEHLLHLRTLLQSAQSIGLRFHMSKCRFGYAELKLLGMGLSRYGLHTVEEKTEAIRDLKPPKTLGDLHRLVGMFSYYRNFIANFAKISAPLNDLKRNKGSIYNSKQVVEWSKEAQDSFEELKKRLSSAPILAHPKFDSRPFILYTDASSSAYAAVLCQMWSHEDYNLDADEETNKEIPMKAFMSISESWKEDYENDPTFRQRYSKLSKSETPEDNGFWIHGDQTLRYRTIYGERICLPLAWIPEVLKISHDVLGHFGTAKTYDRLSDVYYRPKLASLVKTYVKHCPDCIKNKTTRQKMPGSLAPIDKPDDGNNLPAAFESINMDLIVNLPKSYGYDAILVVVDRFTKTGIFTPTTSNFTAESIAEVFLSNVVAKGFLPSKFITDRDPRLIMSFWKTICRRLKIDHRKTSAFHAQADGAAERMNQTLEIALRNYVSPRQNDWSKHLYLMELAYNTAKNTTTGFAPYELLYAQPQNPVERLLRPDIPPLADDIDMDVNMSADNLLMENAARLRDAQQAIVRAMESQKEFYDRKHGPMPNYRVGDYASIRLDRHPVSIIKRNKLSQQKLPPYRITKIVSGGRAVVLDISPSISIWPTISIQHLEPAPAPKDDPFKRTNETGEMRIVDHRDTRGGQRKFRVHWEGLGAERDEWRSRKKTDAELIKEYEDSLQAKTFAATSTEKKEATSRKVDEPFPTIPPPPGKQIERPILYISRATKPYEKAYHATELEMGCVSWAMTRLSQYLEGSKVIVISDHEPLKGVVESSPATRYSTRIDKFRMLLMPFLDNMEIIYKPGSKMTNVDPLSRAQYENTLPETAQTQGRGEGGE